MRLIGLIILLGMLGSCKPEIYTPKPRGYAMIDTPRHAYQPFDRAGYPYYFEYPVYGRITHDSSLDGANGRDPYWINMDFPSFGATIYLSYKVIDANHKLQQLLEDAHEMSYFHTKKADYINEPVFHTRHGVHGVIYSVGGNAASSYQFFATDSTKHFLRGALYFNTTPNADSLQPVTNFLHTDIEHFLGSLEWR